MTTSNVERLSEIPNHILADRVWSGMNWHYPHLEKFKERVAELEKENAVLVEEITVRRRKKKETRFTPLEIKMETLKALALAEQATNSLKIDGL